MSLINRISIVPIQKSSLLMPGLLNAIPQNISQKYEKNIINFGLKILSSQRNYGTICFTGGAGGNFFDVLF